MVVPLCFVCFFFSVFFGTKLKQQQKKKGPCVNEGDLKLVFKDIETHTHTQRNEAIGMRCRPGLSVINVVQNGGRTDERFRLDFSFSFSFSNSSMTMARACWLVLVAGSPYVYVTKAGLPARSCSFHLWHVGIVPNGSFECFFQSDRTALAMHSIKYIKSTAATVVRVFVLCVYI